MSKKKREVTQAELNNKETWLLRPIEERLKFMSSLVIPHPQFTHAIDEIVARSRDAQVQEKGNALILEAETGGGKSTLAKTIQRMHPDVETEDRTIRRAVLFSTPPRPSSASMSSAILKALGDPRWDKGRTDVLAQRALHLLNECKTEIILLDNSHDIPERRKANGVREVGNWIRDIIDNVPALFVSLGAKQGKDVFKANNQVRRRSPAAVRIEYFDYTTPIGMGRLMRFLLELDIALPLGEMSNLSAFDTAKRIGIATNGIPDYIVKLVTGSLKHAVQNKREKITLNDFRIGFKKLYEETAPDDINPFSPDAKAFRKLDKVEEPFEAWLEDGYV